MINLACVTIADGMTQEDIFQVLEEPFHYILDTRIQTIEHTVPELIGLYNAWKMQQNRAASVPADSDRPDIIEISND